MNHLCANKCPRFNGERCKTCLVPEPEPEILVRPDEAEILPAPEAKQPCLACATRTQNLLIAVFNATAAKIIAKRRVLLWKTIAGASLAINVLLIVAAIGGGV